MPSVLAILADGFEEIETMAPLDLLRRASANVVTASLGHDLHVKGRSNIIVHADQRLEELLDRDFDCLMLPGGPGVKVMREDTRIAQLAARYAHQGRWVAAICAAPTVLHNAGLLRGRRYTAHPSVAGELTEIIGSERVVVDGRIVTSRGAGTSLDFGLTLVRLLVSEAKAQEIAAAICL
jgi:4-methyl-5(b-hydroxyethyl)-thiazole monophosphate biosynthesis